MKQNILTQNLFIAFFVGIVLTLSSLNVESSYEYCYKEICSTRTAWGFPFSYVFDGEGSSPAMSINIEDDKSPLLFFLNVVIYSSGAFLVLHTLSSIKRRRSNVVH